MHIKLQESPHLHPTQSANTTHSVDHVVHRKSPIASSPTRTANTHTTQIESLKAEEDACVLPRFDSDVAWELGTVIRAQCQKHERPAVVYIAHANSSQLLFFAASRPGTLPDNMHWVKRKEAVVLRWGTSTLRMRMQMESSFSTTDTQMALKAKYEMADPSVYACHGGGFPVRVEGVEGVVGVIVVSGLKQEDDHAVIVEGIREYLGRVRQ